MIKITLLYILNITLLFSNKTNAQLFGGWILPNDCGCSYVGNGNGNSLDNASLSCKLIKEMFPTSTDGIYFVDIVGCSGSLAPFRAYCDMTTDGGGSMFIGKSKFTPLGPSKIEITGNLALNNIAIDPWSGGTLPAPLYLTTGNSRWTEPDEFTTPTAPNYNPLGYRGNALQTPTDNKNTEAPNELYAILSRDIIETYRTNCNATGTIGEKRLKTVIRQTQGGVRRYIQSEKHF